MIVGVDIGYGYTKAVAPTMAVAFPSVVGKAERIRYESELRHGLAEDGQAPLFSPTWRGPAAQAGAATSRNAGIALITEEGDRFVGELALLQSRVQWTLLDRSRVEDPSARLLFLAALSELIGGVEGSYTFRVVTGLPVNWYADRDKVTRQLAGRHVVRRVNGSQAIQRLSVEDVLVVPQPFGSLFDAILEPDGQIGSEELARGRLAVIDIGTYTTDYVLVDGLRYIERGSGSIPSGMSKAYQLISRSLLDTYALDLRMHEVDRIVHQGTVTLFGEQRSVDWLTQPVFDALAEEVLAQAGTLWGDGRELRAILITGGGAVALGSRIQQRYPHARVLDDPAMANVKGFQKYGTRKWRSIEAKE